MSSNATNAMPWFDDDWRRSNLFVTVVILLPLAGFGLAAIIYCTITRHKKQRNETKTENQRFKNSQNKELDSTKTNTINNGSLNNPLTDREAMVSNRTPAAKPWSHKFNSEMVTQIKANAQAMDEGMQKIKNLFVGEVKEQLTQLLQMEQMLQRQVLLELLEQQNVTEVAGRQILIIQMQEQLELLSAFESHIKNQLYDTNVRTLLENASKVIIDRWRRQKRLSRNHLLTNEAIEQRAIYKVYNAVLDKVISETKENPERANLIKQLQETSINYDDTKVKAKARLVINRQATDQEVNSEGVSKQTTLATANKSKNKKGVGRLGLKRIRRKFKITRRKTRVKAIQTRIKGTGRRVQNMPKPSQDSNAGIQANKSGRLAQKLEINKSSKQAADEQKVTDSGEP